MSSTKYLVINENTLAYQFEGQTMLGCLAGKIREGGRNPMNGVFHISPLDKVREATVEDFDSFRVCSKGYFN